MPKETEGQRETVDRVMHEYKHGELKSGPEGKGGKVESRRQAIAIAMSEAGESRDQSAKQKKKTYARTRSRQAHGGH